MFIIYFGVLIQQILTWFWANPNICDGIQNPSDFEFVWSCEHVEKNSLNSPLGKPSHGAYSADQVLRKGGPLNMKFWSSLKTKTNYTSGKVMKSGWKKWYGLICFDHWFSIYWPSKVQKWAILTIFCWCQQFICSFSYHKTECNG